MILGIKLNYGFVVSELHDLLTNLGLADDVLLAVSSQSEVVKMSAHLQEEAS